MKTGTKNKYIGRDNGLVHAEYLWIILSCCFSTEDKLHSAELKLIVCPVVVNVSVCM